MIIHPYRLDHKLSSTLAISHAPLLQGWLVSTNYMYGNYTKYGTSSPQLKNLTHRCHDRKVDSTGTSIRCFSLVMYFLHVLYIGTCITLNECYVYISDHPLDIQILKWHECEKISSIIHVTGLWRNLRPLNLMWNLTYATSMDLAISTFILSQVSIIIIVSRSPECNRHTEWGTLHYVCPSNRYKLACSNTAIA